ncbi:MAG: PD-(D/E)XK nuclease family protein, partial [Pelagibacteraceae bacterium]
LDRVKGLKEPSMPGWSLNSAVDELLKKEFDFHRKEKTPHTIMVENKLNFIPFDHPEINKWRDSLTGGISYLDEQTNLIIKGGVDDIWFNQDTKELIVVDYKAQSTNYAVEPKSYLESKFHQGYKRQMDIYVHILKNMNFKISNTTYFLVCNAEKSFKKFNEKLNFTVTLIPYVADPSWIPDKIKQMKEILESENIPEFNENCERCTYLFCGNEIKGN